VRVQFEDHWDGHKGEVIRRRSIMPAAWRKGKPRRKPLIEEVHAPKTPKKETAAPRTPKGRVSRAGSSAATSAASTPTPSRSSSVASRRDSLSDVSQIPELESEITALRERLVQLKEARREATDSRRPTRFAEAKQAKGDIDDA
jgi:hypothetical protein